MILCWAERQSIWHLVLMIWLFNASGVAMANNADFEPDITTTYRLDPSRRVVVQTIGEEVEAPQVKKYVQVEVMQVFNPHRIPLSFNVHYQSRHGAKSLLGTFSLFPPDNPGTFIVATGGKLQAGGKVIVSLVPLEPVYDQQKLSVLLKRFTFRGK
jgi:hypothetical protein